MRLTASRTTACLTVSASLCIMSTTITRTTAFLAPSTIPSSSGFARGHGWRAARAQCSTSPVPTRMTANVRDSSNSDGDAAPHGWSSKLSGVRRSARVMFRRSQDPRQEQETCGGDAAAAVSGGSGGLGKRMRARAVARKSMAAFATAVVVRSAFNPQPALAVSYRPRARTTEQKRVDQERLNAQKRAQLEAKLREATPSASRAPTATVEGEGGVAGEAGVDANGEPLAEGQAAVAAPVRVRPPSLSEQMKGMDKEQKRAYVSAQIAKNPNALEMSNRARMGTLSSLAIGGFAVYNVISSVRGSSDVMGRQRRRVKVETAKFDQQKDEFMNVDGEATVDVDMMKELRDMKEKMAGPGDTYAKDTRKYNPEFAAEHPEDEYDAKIEEALNKAGKRSNTPKSGKTGVVFQNDDAPSASAPSKGDDLLGEAGGDGAAAEGNGGKSNADADANAAMQAKKDADVKRLQDLFNNSPSDDSDSPEDDLGDKRELSP